MNEHSISLKLDKILELLESQNVKKEWLNFKEGRSLLGLSASAMYKLTSGKRIKFYRATGKKISFKRTDIVSFLERNPVRSIEEIEKSTLNNLIKKTKKHES
jgi:excisionase family DNA binding protein